jgi:hypothetical protein
MLVLIMQWAMMTAQFFERIAIRIIQTLHPLCCRLYRMTYHCIMNINFHRFSLLI